jgi:molybdopterin synthase sulfur carrier subunit
MISIAGARPMHSTVLLFAQLADATGTDLIDLELPDGSTVRDALDLLSARHEPIAAMRDRIAVAVNEQYEHPDATLPDGCTIALIPPVSGG